MSTSLLNPLLESGLAVARTMGQVSWQVALWALVVWVLTRAWPTLPASVRTTLWWLVGLKCLVGMFALGSLNLPLLPAPEAPAAPVERVTPGAALAATARPPAPDAPRVSSRQEATPEGSTWTLVLLLPWLGGLAWQTRTLLQELRHLRHLRRESRPLEDASLLQVARELGQEMGLARRPQVRVSEQATSPFAFNPWRPEVIL
ncbi:MAG: M56 family metallopeptidase, partial [Cystobacter sp.]